MGVGRREAKVKSTVGMSRAVIMGWVGGAFTLCYYIWAGLMKI